MAREGSGPAAPEALVVTMKAEPDGALMLRSVELVARRSRVRFSFPGEADIASALSGAACAEMASLARKALERPGMLAMPDHVARLGGLVLSDCSVIVAGAVDGGEQIMVRFNRHRGALLTFFAEGSHARRALAGDPESLMIEALEKAYMPLFDFAQHVERLLERGELAPGTPPVDALISINRRIQALQIYRALMRDSVAESAPSLPPPTTTLRLASSR